MTFQNRNVYKAIRDIYLHPRSPAREKELRELFRDVDFYISELHRLENRLRIPNLVSSQLLQLCIRLRYMEDRHKYKSDLACFKRIAREFSRSIINIQQIIMDPDKADEWWLTEIEGGKEQD